MKQVSVQLDDELYEALRLRARQEGRAVSMMARRLLGLSLDGTPELAAAIDGTDRRRRAAEAPSRVLPPAPAPRKAAAARTGARRPATPDPK